MRLRTALLLTLVSVPALLPAVAQTASISQNLAVSAVPPLIRYSGIAKGSDGKPLSGEVNISFLLYSQEEGGSPLWVESQSVPLDSAGHYQVQLGAASVNGIPLELFANGDARWLDIEVAGQAPQPRVLLVSVPYALKAADATTLGGLPASAYALASKANTTPTISAAVTPATVTDVTTTGGTAGSLSEFSGAATVVDSPVFVLGADVGIGTAAPTATLDVNGTALITGALSTDSSAAFGGTVTVEAAGKATTAAGESSHSLALQTSSYNSGSSEAVAQTFEWRAVPVGNDTATASGSLEVLFGQGTATPVATGFAIGANGQISFAAGQTFPGTGKGTITGVTAGTALTGGGTTGAVTVNLDTTKVPLLGASNTFSGNQTVTGSVTAASFSGSGAGLTRVTAANSAELGGLTPAAFAELAASNTFSATQSFSSVGIGTTTPRSLLEGQAAASKALGPVFTLTNTLGGLGAESALDFNTLLPSSTGTYNPMARIAAQDANHYSDNLIFQSNIPGAQNSGLQTNLIIQSNGQVGIDTPAPGAQLEVDANPTLGTDGIYGFGATTTGGSGTFGVEGFGGASIAANAGGIGGYFAGGYAQGTGNGGDGIDAAAGGTADSSAAAGYAGYFSGDVNVTGTLSAGAKDFEIDHPLDPSNKYLNHASVESSEMMNIYSGNVTTDELGLATVALPDWFEAENTDFRYQLTIVGRKAQAWISQEVANGQFKISTDATNVKVSWQITAVRQDAFAKAHPLVVEEEKPAREKGFYIHPELYGQPLEKQIQWARSGEVMRRIKTLQAQQKNALAKTATP